MNRTILLMQHFGWQGGTWSQVNKKLYDLKLVKGTYLGKSYMEFSDWEFLRLLDKLNTLGYYIKQNLEPIEDNDEIPF